MSGPKRNPDRLNTIGIVVVGICGAVLVYVTIVALQAFYVNDTSEVQTAADYGNQDLGAKSLRTEQLSKINDWGSNPKPQPPKAGEAPHPQSYRIAVDVAMKRVVEDAKTDPGMLIPTLGRSDRATVQPIFGRPKPLATAPAAAPAAPAAGQVPGAPAAPAAPGAPPAAGAATDVPAAPQVPTGAGTGPSPVGGAGPLDSHPATPAQKAPSGATAPAAAAPLPAVPARPRQSGAPKGNGK